MDTATNTMVEYPYYHKNYHETGHHEIMSSFLRSHNLIPIWHDVMGDWGHMFRKFDWTGNWTEVERLVSEIPFQIS